MTCTNAVLVTSPDLRHSFVSHDPLDVLDGRYPLAQGWLLQPVTGRHTPYGFITPTSTNTKETTT